MKIMKKIVDYTRIVTILFAILLCSTSHLSAQTEPQTQLTVEPTPQTANVSEADKTTNATAAESTELKLTEEKATEVLPIKEEKKDEKTVWSDHLQALLTKGSFWNTATNTPTLSWQDDAYTYVQALLKKDISAAEELKTSFFNTVESKFTSIENISNLKGFFGVIDSFNKKIEGFLSELTPKEQKKENEPQDSKVDVSASKEQIQKNVSAESEETQKEESAQTTDDVDTTKIEAKKKKQETEWKECLQNIKTDGTEEREVEIIVDNTINAAKKILLSTAKEQQNEKVVSLKEELKNALNERSPSLYAIDPTLVLQRFDQTATTLFAKPQEEQPPLPLIASAQKNEQKKPPIKPEKPQSQEKEKKEETKPTETPAEQPVFPPVIAQQSKVPTMTSTPVPNLQAQIAERARAEELLKTKEYQEMLTKKIRMAALEKAAAEKAEAEKGILTKVAETVFGEWWAPKTHKQTLEQLQKEQDNVIDQIIKNKFDKNTKEQIKAAYHVFQKTLLSFNSTAKKYWNSSTNTPTQKWMKDLLSPLERVLLKLDVMSVDSVVTAIKETLNTKMRAKEYEEVIEVITKNLQATMEKINHERTEVQRLNALEEQQEREEMIKREAQAQEMAVLEEQKQQLAAAQQQKEKEMAGKRFTKLEKDWEDLIQKIQSAKETSKKNQQELDAALTEKALATTRTMLELAEITLHNKHDIVEKHKADFSTALIKQNNENKDFNINIYEDYLSKFLVGLKP